MAAAWRAAQVNLRPETPEDSAFLEDLFLATFDEEPGWRLLLPAERTRLLRQQLSFREASYRKDFPEAWFTIIDVDGKPAGRLVVARRVGEMRVVDMELLPDFRGHGIGSRLMKQVQTEACRLGLPVRLSAMAGSAAERFYGRLGFVKRAAHAVHMEYEWRAKTE